MNLLGVFFVSVAAAGSPEQPSSVGPLPAMDVSRKSPIGWTDAHNVAYGLPLVDGGPQVPKDSAVAFLDVASDEFLCAQNDYGQTALHLAVRQNHVPVVDLYARRRLCLNVANNDGDTPLHYAAVFQRTTAVWTLLGAGADPSLTNEDGDTPLDDAEAHRAKKVIGILKAARENPHTPRQSEL